MADVPRVKLSELVGRFGSGLSRDARQCKALLADVCGNQYRAECAVLVAAVDEGVAGELLGSSSGLPTEVLLGRLSDRLHANRGVANELARWSVETWAVALGVAAGGNTLAKFKMDELAPLIDLAGADGTITDARLDHLVAEAKTRGVSEADARAYLSACAATRGWQVGRSRQRRQRAAAPPPPQQASPQPQPVQLAPVPQPAPDRTFRYALAGVAALVAIAVIVAIARVTPQPPPQAPTTAAPAPAPAPSPAPSPLPNQADREQQAYNAARGNAAALHDYVSSCSICTYAPAARSEISRLETPPSPTQTPGTATDSYLRNRYLKAACGSIVDTFTDLQWYLGSDVTVSWGDAAEWVHQLSACGGVWTLPTMGQLKSLFDERLSAGTGFYVNGRYWPAHIDPVFSAIGGGSWVWADGSRENGTAPAINFHEGVGVRISPFGTPYTVRAFAVKKVMTEASQPGAAYAQAVSDWRAYKAWSDAQTGDRRAGMTYWAANRNVRDHLPCDEQAEKYSDSAAPKAAFDAGCEEAKAWLDPIDARRADPQYRAGFNDEASRSPLNR